MQESTEYTYPNTVTFACDEGYVLTGQSILRCESNGQWSGSSPKCQPSGEFNPSVPPAYSTPQYPSGVRVMDSGQGYLLNVNPQVSTTHQYPWVSTTHQYLSHTVPFRCESNGQWSGSSPKLQPSGEFNPSVPSGEHNPLVPPAYSTHQYP